MPPCHHTPPRAPVVRAMKNNGVLSGGVNYGYIAGDNANPSNSPGATVDSTAQSSASSTPGTESKGK